MKTQARTKPGCRGDKSDLGRKCGEAGCDLGDPSLALYMGMGTHACPLQSGEKNEFVNTDLLFSVCISCVPECMYVMCTTCMQEPVESRSGA